MAQDGVVYIDTLQHLSVTLVASVTGQNVCWFELCTISFPFHKGRFSVSRVVMQEPMKYLSFVFGEFEQLLPCHGHTVPRDDFTHSFLSKTDFSKCNEGDAQRWRHSGYELTGQMMKNAINQTIISNATAQQACAVQGCMMETIAGSSISHQSPTKSPHYQFSYLLIWLVVRSRSLTLMISTERLPVCHRQTSSRSLTLTRIVNS